MIPLRAGAIHDEHDIGHPVEQPDDVVDFQISALPRVFAQLRGLQLLSDDPELVRAR